MCCCIPHPRPRLKSTAAPLLLAQALEGLQTMAIWVQLPFAAQQAGQPPATSSPAAAAAAGGKAAAADGGGSSSSNSGTAAAALDPWCCWWQLFTLCEHSNLLGVILEVPQVRGI